jgi:hypothetical protein
MSMARLSRTQVSTGNISSTATPPITTADTQVPFMAADRRPIDLITPAAAADILSVNAKVLERWRSTGDGPAYAKLSSKTIRYRREDIDAFVAARVRASTAAAA